MRHAKFATILMAAVLLSGCSRTFHGVKNDTDDFGRWVNGKPSHDERNYGKAPTGYAGTHEARDLAMDPPPHGTEAKWKEERRLKMERAIATQSSTTTTTTTTSSDNTMPAPANYGDLSQQVYFPHGSAKIAPRDKQRLTTFGDSVKDQPVDLTVVGHASTRVNGNVDEVKKKEINFEIAQKRATAVTKVLKQSGVKPGYIQSVSQGDDVPNPDPGMKDQESADRRVEVYKAATHD